MGLAMSLDQVRARPRFVLLKVMAAHGCMSCALAIWLKQHAFGVAVGATCVAYLTAIESV
ncbi:MAG: hypothetical protein AAF601_12135 [Pseudomonadota bacterium]